jgi:hypothetical protein
VTAAALRARGARVSVEDATSAFRADDTHELLKASMVAGFLDGDSDDEPVWLGAGRRPGAPGTAPPAPPTPPGLS